MSDDDLCYTPGVELARLIARRELSPVELLDAVIARIERLEPRLNAFAAFAPEPARAAARAAEQAVARGETLGPLHGLPVTIKDLADVAGLPSERGSWTMRGNVAAADSPFVARLRAAGAIVLGKTTTSEYGWKGVSHSPLTGITSNPWRDGYNAGASSAGAGAGAAAGYGPLHQGSDGAGSIRMPAHFSGVVGFKATFGRVPNVPVRNNDQTSHNGPMSRTVADSALMLGDMSGPHPLDHYSLDSPPVDYLAGLDGSLDGLRIAYSPDLGHARVDDEVASVVADAVRDIEAAGAHVEPVTPDFARHGPELVRFFWGAHALANARHLPAFRDRMDPGLVACMESAQAATAADYVRVRGLKLDYVAAIHAFFEQHHLLLTPAVSVAAFPADRLAPAHWPEHPWDWLTWAEFSYPFNFSGNPAASVPAGFTAAGLPVGVQIVGRRFDDLGVLRASRVLEQLRPWADRRPPLD